jgi:hypothetical protein
MIDLTLHVVVGEGCIQRKVAANFVGQEGQWARNEAVNPGGREGQWAGPRQLTLVVRIAVGKKRGS